jgi:predicted phage terminase large subunit-like protein
MTEKEAIARYEASKAETFRRTTINKNETVADKKKRIAELLGSFDKFCKYYFPQYFLKENGGAEFGHFHKSAAKKIIENKSIFAVLEWPREHAKSVFADIFIPLYLKARGEFTGMIIASAVQSSAATLLSDIQGQLEANQRFINDYGVQFQFGDWKEGKFQTKDGCGFWSVGKGGKPRGLREEFLRPNFCVIDDIDDDEECRNPDRLDATFDWVMGALIGALALNGSRVILAGNRIAKDSILSRIVGDVNEGDPLNQDIYHSKVFALENPKTHKEDQSETGVPAWKERYTRAILEARFKIIRYRMTQREYFHRHIIEGKLFKKDWLRFGKPPKISDFEAIVTYNDPSFKDSKKNDYKAIVTVGKYKNQWWILDVWVRQATRSAMVQAHYDLHEKYTQAGAKILKHYIEANFMQDMLIEDYVLESKNRGYMMPIAGDLRAKPNKQGRIENMAIYFERGLCFINEAIRSSQDWQNFVAQLLGFPTGHDDGPDAFEGAMFIINTICKSIIQIAVYGGKRRRDRIN